MNSAARAMLRPGEPRRHPAIFLRALLAGALCAGAVARAQDMALPGWDDAGTDDLIEDFENQLAAEAHDYDALARSHLSNVYRWQGVESKAAKAGEEKAAFSWKIVSQSDFPPRTFVSPVNETPLTTTVRVPEKGTYRLWLCYAAEPGRAHPVALDLAGANTHHHVFGALRLPSATGNLIEEKYLVRFEDELARLSPFAGRTPVWEHSDLELVPGDTELRLSSEDAAAQVDCVFLTTSKSFTPSKSHLPGDGNLYRTYYRVRVAESVPAASHYEVKGAGLGYHWRRIYRGETQPRWYGQLGAEDKLGFRSPSDELRIPVGEWTRWVDVTQDISDGPWARGGGPWATGRFTFGGVTRGVAEVQLAWFSHEGAVLKTTRPGIAAAAAVFMVPLEAQATPPDSGTNLLAGAWGMRLDEIVDRFETAADTHVRHFEWGRQAVADLGLRADAPTPRLLRLDTGCSAAPAALETAQRMLTALGLNDVGVKDPALLKELGQEAHHFIGANDSQYLCLTHDPLDPVAERNFEKSLRAQANRLAGPRGNPLPPVTLKMGDEIGAVVGAASINGLATCRKAFMAYLADFLKANQLDPSFFGVETLEELSYIGTRPLRAGLFERRLSYHCEKFKFVLTAMYYAQITRAAERVFPSVQTYCNFSPHPPMFGQHMNGSDWFTLTREGGANTAWGEGWASGGGWGFVGHEVVSYYAAWVECAGRTGANPAGFYVVGTMGGADKKMLSLVAHGIFNIQLYSWGPIYAGAEGSNYWSERRETYAEIARGAYALGPADEIIARGRREPRRIALLYNRTHEIWNGADGGFQSDRLLTFMALTHAHMPVDIILVEDLTPERLAAYKALYIQGYNLNKAALPVLRNWVADGGILVAAAGTATRDEYDSPLPEAETLFGAAQRFSAQSSGNWHPQHLPSHAAIDQLTLRESALTPSMSVDVIGVQYDILPTTATPVGTFQDGSCGAALNTIGKGQALLLGVTPGHIYKGKTEGSSRYTLENGPIITKAAAAAIPERVADYSDPQTEICLFEHESGLAVTLNNFAHFREDKDRTAVLTVATDRDVREVVSSLRGALTWERDGACIRITVPAPNPVDVVVIR